MPHDRVRRRGPAEGPRSTKVVVRLSTAELADVRIASQQADAAVGAWMGEVAVVAARGGSGHVLRRLLGQVVAARALVDDKVLGDCLDAAVDALTEHLS